LSCRGRHPATRRGPRGDTSGGFLGIATPYGYGWDKTRVGILVLLISLVRYVFRHVVQHGTRLRLREEVPLVPEQAPGAAELPPTGVAPAH
jgi:hypothetical protein